MNADSTLEEEAFLIELIDKICIYTDEKSIIELSQYPVQSKHLLLSVISNYIFSTKNIMENIFMLNRLLKQSLL